MQAQSNTNQPLPIGQTVRLFTENKCKPGSTIEIIDSRGNVVNMARVQSATTNPIKGARQPYTAILQVTA